MEVVGVPTAGDDFQGKNMSQQSLLVSLDGSIYSRYAANLCWQLAKSTGAKVTALHVIDTSGAREFGVQEPTGFLQHKEYQSLYDGLCKQLRQLAKSLSDNYLSEAAKHGVTTDFVIDEGDPVTAISKRALAHDLVVIGHRPNKSSLHMAHRRQFLRLSIAEALSHECPRPLLIVQDDTPLWSEMTVLLSIDHLNEQYIDACLNLSNVLDVKPNILCLSTGEHEGPATSLIRDLKEANPKLKDITVEVTTLEDVSTINGQSFPGHCILRPDAGQMHKTLPVIPTRELAGNRITILGGSPSLLVRFLALSTILLLPEEHLLQPAVPAAPIGSLNQS
jgi:nucleotide-binding universal stress UspA family protein